MFPRARLLSLLVIGLGPGAAGCPPDTPPGPVAPAVPDDEEVVLTLLAHENDLRGRIDFARRPPYSARSGPNPQSVFGGPDGRPLVVSRGVLSAVEGDSLVPLVSLIDAERGCARRRDVAVIGRARAELTLWQAPDRVPVRVPLPGALTPRGVACDAQDRVVVVDEAAGEVRAFVPAGASLREVARRPAGDGVAHVVAVGDVVVTGSVTGHDVRAFAWRGGSLVEVARHTLRTPVFGLAARAEATGAVTVFVGTLQQDPLDRRPGFFGDVDAALLTLRLAGDALRVVGQRNLGEDGVITPKALCATPGGVHVAGAGSDVLLFVPDDGTAPRARPVPAGSAALWVHEGRYVIANPLLDAVVTGRVNKGPARVIDQGPVLDEAERRVRLGEALFFTRAMAPHQTSDGQHSRFTCETCHFEGRIDGRVHFTGRGDVHASTKSLRGVFENRPHFSRALDANVATMVHAEFRVANAGTDHSPWFALDIKDLPWLTRFAPGPADRTPWALRRALMDFLAVFAPEKNPHVRGRQSFAPLEQQGATLFAQHCERCHQARAITDDPRTRVPPAEWSSFIFRDHNLVWARDGYEQTGIVPYVHPRGARPPSLRRVFEKRPYFTNGAATSLSGVLDAARTGPAGFVHAPPPDEAAGDWTAFSPEEKAALEAFLLLL